MSVVIQQIISGGASLTGMGVVLPLEKPAEVSPEAKAHAQEGAEQALCQPTTTWHLPPPKIVKEIRDEISPERLNGAVTMDYSGDANAVDTNFTFQKGALFSLNKHFLIDKNNKGELLVIGQGGMGRVYRGIVLDDLFGIPKQSFVAIKSLNEGAETDGKAIQRFEREKDILAKLNQLNHPNIVRSIAQGKLNGFDVLVMEYVEGKDLDDFIKDRKLTPEWVDELLKYLKQIAEAAGAAHSIGIIHKDIKPGNILIGTNKQAKLTDFGISKDESRLTKITTGGITGTVDYAAPEQLKGKVSHYSDIYPFGVILYKVFLGEHPVDIRAFNTDDDILPKSQAISYSSPRHPDEIQPDNKLNSTFKQFMYKLVCNDPNEREPVTMIDLAQDLEAFKGNVFVESSTQGQIVIPISQKRRTWVRRFLNAITFGWLG